jgi:hypothetical protein
MGGTPFPNTFFETAVVLDARTFHRSGEISPIYIVAVMRLDYSLITIIRIGDHASKEWTPFRTTRNRDIRIQNPRPCCIISTKGPNFNDSPHSLYQQKTPSMAYHDTM